MNDLKKFFFSSKGLSPVCRGHSLIKNVHLPERVSFKAIYGAIQKPRCHLGGGRGLLKSYVCSYGGGGLPKNNGFASEVR